MFISGKKTEHVKQRILVEGHPDNLAQSFLGGTAI